jgi:hypothetical protein
MMIRMQQDNETIYVVNAHRFNGDEIKAYGHGYEGEMRSVSRPGHIVWEVNIDSRGPDPVRALAHELGSAESSRHGGEHDQPGVDTEDKYRKIRGCNPRRYHSNNYAGVCP